MAWRLGLDIGTNSIGWAVLGLDGDKKPFEIIKTGSRIFSDGRNPKDGHHSCGRLVSGSLAD